MNKIFSKILKPIEYFGKTLNALDYLGLLFVVFLCIFALVYYLIKLIF
jgi:hypothetical protein